MVFISVFSGGLGALVHYSRMNEYKLIWHYWVMAGALGGLGLSLFGSFLDFFIMKKRQRMLKSPLFIKLQNQLSLQPYKHLLAGYYDQHPVSIGWSFLPIGKTPRPGIFIFTVFKPTGSEKLFEIKKRIPKGSKLLVESFYIYQFIILDKKTIDVPQIEKLIKENVKIIDKYSTPPLKDKCINCHADIPPGDYRIINDIPVPICRKCEKKVGK